MRSRPSAEPLALDPFRDLGPGGVETPRRTRLIRIAALGAALASTGYLIWRIAVTITPETALIGIPLLLTEVYALITLVLFTALLWDIRSGRNPGVRERTDATVDVVIPTYSESWEVLLPTVAAARALPLVRDVWLLDDGDRAWAHELADDLGVHYRARSGSEDAKAGNINAALPEIDADLIAVFDADHVAHADFVRHTVGYFDDPLVAIVQTPQEFYNEDSFEHLGSGDGHFADQDVFYRVVGPGRDTSDAAFWCGTNAMIRRSALVDVGGVATGTVTEDILTSVRLQRRGWKVVYHNEVLARGLAAADAEQYLKQRVRWGTGTMQLLRSADNPLLARDLTRGQRLGYWSTALGWFDGWRALLLLVLAPVILVTGLSPVEGPVVPFVILFVISFAAQRIALSLLSRGLGPMLSTSLFEIVRLPAMLRVTLALFTKREPHFEVTAKGRTGERVERIRTPRIFLVLLVAFVVGLGVFVWSTLFGGPVSYMSDLVAWTAAGWTLVNVALVVAAIRRITHDRFAGERRASVRFDGTGAALLNGIPVEVRDISLTGIRLGAAATPPPGVGSAVQIGVAGLELQATVRTVSIGEAGITEVRAQFDEGDRTRLAQLALRLFRTSSALHVEWEQPVGAAR